jgi:Zn-dependent peptidase ImmA (M78 family)
MLRWARERAGHRDVAALRGRFPRLAAWESGEAQPTLYQVEAFARAVHVPFGYLFLPAPPDEPLPIPDFRTVAGQALRRPSPDLLDTIYAAQDRQAWYRDFARLARQEALDFVGSARLDEAPESVAARISERLGVDPAARADCRTREEALRLFVAKAEAAGVLVMVSGIVRSNTRRVLDPREFRGFALADSLAPVVFVNGSDARSAQMFTLAHELAHLWLGASALSDAGLAPPAGQRREEVWCNAVAAELLVPLAELRPLLRPGEALDDTVGRLARHFKVSSLVVLRRLLDAGWLDRGTFETGWAAEQARLRDLMPRSEGGGDFYRSTLVRVSRRFARALVESTLEGQTLYSEAFRLLGVRKTATFNEIARLTGVAP